jgi:hypothetical protein
MFVFSQKNSTREFLNVLFYIHKKYNIFKTIAYHLINGGGNVVLYL